MPRGVRTIRRAAAALCAAATLAVPGTALAASTPPPPPAPPPTVPPAPAGIPMPKTPAGLPADIEDLQPYVAQDSCDPTDKPGVAAFLALLKQTYPDSGSDGISYSCGTDGGTSEHYEGRALDWAVSVTNAHQVAEVQALFHWLFAPDAAGHEAAMARRLGLMYVIWDKHILGTYALSAGWRDYSCSGVTGCHQDHVHFSFGWAGARKATSFWTGQVAPVDYGPCRVAGLSTAPTSNGTANPDRCDPVDVSWPAASAGDPSWLPALERWSGATLKQGFGGPAVSALQSALGVTADGSFGPQTLSAVQDLQRGHGLAPTGVMDVPTWRALLTGVNAAPPVQPVAYGGVCPTAVTVPFRDVADDSHVAAIACMAHLGVLHGRTATTFAPTGVVNREQMASFLAGLLTSAGVTLPAGAPLAFTDEPSDSVHATAVAQLAQLGVLRGVTADRFEPASPVNRAQMASFLARVWTVATGAPLPPSTDNPYTDLELSDLHTPDVLAVTAAGIAKGQTATAFAPGAVVRRDQMAEFLARTADALVGAGKVQPALAR